MSEGRRRRLIVVALAVTAALTLGVNVAVRHWARKPVVEAWAGLTVKHPTRQHALHAGAAKTVPVGLYGEFAEPWKRSRATYSVLINPQGYRERPFGPKQTPRIVALGDSSTFGWDVEAKDAWPKVLESVLNAEGRPAEVLNLGVPGYSSHQGLLLLPEVWGLEPDLLIVAYGRNDEMAAAPDANGRVRTDAELMPRVAPAGGLDDRPREVGVVNARRPPPKRPGEEDDAANVTRRVPALEFADNLRAMVAAAREHGARVILLSVGSVTEEYRQAPLVVARGENIPAVNAFPLLFSKVEKIQVEPEFAGCREKILDWLGRDTIERSQGGWLWFSTDFAHPNACGHRIIADALAPLAESLLAPPPPKKK
jgi:lysophospholipase L1-like esterase